jgi:fumarate reductase flavoprotein subunit
LHALYAGAIAVNLEGKRFVDESLPYRAIGNACLEQPKATAFQLFDQKTMDQSRTEPITRNFASALARNLIRSASGIRRAADLMGLNPDTLTATVDRYNSFVEADCDQDFGRASLLGGNGAMVRIDRPPYYIYACTTAIVATYAGLVANRRMELVDIFGKPIKGVYVAGEVVGGLHGRHPMSGSAIAKAAIFGRTAGENAARSGNHG